MAVAAIVISANLFAANPSESVNANTTNFVEIEANKTTFSNSILIANYFDFRLLNLEEVKIFAQVKDNDPSKTATAKVMLISSDGLYERGPFNLVEGEVIEEGVSNEYWTVEVIENSEGAVVTHWY